MDFVVISCYAWMLSPAALLADLQLYSKVMVFVLRYSLSASFPRSLPNPDILNPPKGAATSVLL